MWGLSSIIGSCESMGGSSAMLLPFFVFGLLFFVWPWLPAKVCGWGREWVLSGQASHVVHGILSTDQSNALSSLTRTPMCPPHAQCPYNVSNTFIVGSLSVHQGATLHVPLSFQECKSNHHRADEQALVCNLALLRMP